MRVKPIGHGGELESRWYCTGTLEVRNLVVLAVLNAQGILRRVHLAHEPEGSTLTGGEMMKMQNRDVDWTKHRIAIAARNTKSGKARVVPFDPNGRLAEVLKRRRFLGPDAFVFGRWTGESVQNFRSAWESVLLLSAGEPFERVHRKSRVNTEALRTIDLHWRDLGHECASRWRERGLDLEVIQLLLGPLDVAGHTAVSLNINDDELVEAMQEKIWKRA
jgi:integrase